MVSGGSLYYPLLSTLLFLLVVYRELLNISF